MLTPYHSLTSRTHSLITMRLEHYETLNSRFAHSNTGTSFSTWWSIIFRKLGGIDFGATWCVSSHWNWSRTSHWYVETSRNKVQNVRRFFFSHRKITNSSALAQIIGTVSNQPWMHVHITNKSHSMLDLPIMHLCGVFWVNSIELRLNQQHKWRYKIW